MRVNILILTLFIAGGTVSGSFFACRAHPEKIGNAANLQTPEFPFTLMDQKGSIVFIEPKHFTKQNLDSFFLWHYKKYLAEPVAPESRVFTDKAALNLYLEGMRKLNPYSAASDLQSKVTLSAKKVGPDANFYMSPSEPVISAKEDTSSSGYNVWYSFAPDLNQPTKHKTVVLRGATWTEGKYDIETQTLDWYIGQITITAYDLYNTEPTGRYITFGHKTEKVGYKGPYERTRIIFSLRVDKGAALPTLNQIKLLNESVAYAYAGWMYSVTLDSGQTWHWWDTERNLPEWQCCDPNLIQKVKIGLDGIGLMTLKLNPQQPENILKLHTKDYGQHWVK